VLVANENKSFVGTYVLGMGLTFDDTDKKQVASPLSRMHELIASNPHNGERIFPYLGGEEVNDDPEHSHHRYVINFEDFPLKRTPQSPSWADADDNWRKGCLKSGIVPHDYPSPVAEDWPDLLEIVEGRVKPERLMDNRENYRRYWWRFAERRPGLVARLGLIDRAFVVSQTSHNLAVARVSARVVFSHTTIVFPVTEWRFFSVLQSSVHSVWYGVFASTLKDDQRYIPSDCFATFPFPANYEHAQALEAAGREYYDFRAALMVRNKQGLTKTYNRFHDPEEQSDDVRKLRDLHHAMDLAVLGAYGWTDIQPLPRHETEFEEDQTEDDEFSSAKKPKQKYRLRWPEEIRDDVLARLLILNEQRAAAEALEPKTKKKKSKHAATSQLDFADSE